MKEQSVVMTVYFKRIFVLEFIVFFPSKSIDASSQVTLEGKHTTAAVWRGGEGSSRRGERGEVGEGYRGDI